ncbi:MAG: ACP S-malonyltransferase [Bdellovibrionaceae bacterium]|nr:ACP S-malonyltransferase [Bdellovibrio sp.]
MMSFLFPGQGSQAPGMGKFLYDEFKIARETFEEASDAINLNLKKLCFTESPEVLSLTENTQPALLTVSTATARVLQTQFGAKPSLTAGHSVGEYASFVLGGVISLPQAVKAVRLRGQSMQAAVPVGQGGMTAALGLDEAQVQFLCRWTIEQSGYAPLSPANYNCPGQIVISGKLDALNWLKANFKPEILPGEAKRAKLISLQVSAPFHCEMMKPAELAMQKFLNAVTFNNSKIPIIQNVHAQLETDATVLKTNIIKQISAPVRWTQSMQTLKDQHQALAIEVGHGTVLKGLLKKIDAEFFKVYSTNSLDDLKAIESLSARA